MPTSHHHHDVVRTDILELKTQIEKRIGRAKTESYLHLLSKFLTFQIPKSDFDKLIIAIVKSENVTLHNALLRGIIKNVCLSKTPPPFLKNGVVDESENKGVFLKSNSFRSLCEDLPKSPRKGRTHRRFCNGGKGKSHVVEVVSSNGWHGEDGEEVDQLIRCWRSQPIEPPLGVNLIKKRHQRIGTCHSSGELPDSVSLKKKLEDGSGFEVSVGFANSLNTGLDVFLKRLIKPCLELSASRRSSTQGEVSTCSLVDFEVAMELNPSILGEDWPAKLEKIRLLTSDLPTDFYVS